MTPLRAATALLAGAVGFWLAAVLFLSGLFAEESVSETRLVAPLGFLVLGPVAVALLARTQRWAWVGVSVLGVALACGVWMSAGSGGGWLADRLLG